MMLLPVSHFPAAICAVSSHLMLFVCVIKLPPEAFYFSLVTDLFLSTF